MSVKCPDPNCHNNDDCNETFCDQCLLAAVLNMDENDLYDIFVEGEKRLKESIQDGEAHGILSHQERRIINKFKHKWFRTINSFMLKQMNKN